MVKSKKIQSLGSLLKKAQKVFNAWIRKRDENKPCISCGSYNTAHASHFYAAGSYSGLRFTEDNCHLSCASCNTYKHGNLHEYRIGLEKKIGKQRLEQLDQKAQISRFKKYSRFELEQIIKVYGNKV
jgi:hypothetical protein